jgi:hypothetical protein
MVDEMTRSTAGTAERPIDGIPDEKTATNYQVIAGQRTQCGSARHAFRRSGSRRVIP